MQMLGLITFPILTRVLTKEEYGILGLATVTMALLVAVAKAGLSDGIIRFYAEYSGTEQKRLIFSSTAFVRGVIFALSVVVIYVICLLTFYRSLKIDVRFLSCFIILAPYLFIRPLNIIVMNFLRVNGKSIFYNLNSVINKMLSVALSLFLLLYISRALASYFIGGAVVEWLSGLVLFYWFFRNYKISLSHVSWDLTSMLVRFGAPVLLTEIAYLLLAYVDRYMIVYYLGEASLGTYAVGYTLANYVADILNVSVAYAILPVYTKIFVEEGREKTEEFLEKCTHYLLIGMIPISFGFAAVCRDVIVWLASKKYESAVMITPMILAGTCVLGFNTLFYAGLYLRKKTVQILLIVISGALIKICLNLFLLPFMGIEGAGLTTMISCFYVIILTAILSFRHVTIRINIGSLAYHLLMGFLMFVVVRHVHVREGFINLAIKVFIGVIVVLPAVLLRETELRGWIKSYGGRILQRGES